MKDSATPRERLTGFNYSRRARPDVREWPDYAQVEAIGGTLCNSARSGSLCPLAPFEHHGLCRPEDERSH